MRLLDRLMELDSSECVEGHEPYDVYRAGLKGVVVGGAAIVGGKVLEAVAGVEVGPDLALAGFIVEGLGCAALVAGIENFESTREW